MPAIMKGIPPDQSIVNMPTNALSKNNDISIPVLIGKGMASNTKLKVGDTFIIRWLDADRHIFFTPHTQTDVADHQYLCDMEISATTLRILMN